MCEAILIGMRRQMRVDGYSKSGEVGANIVMLDGDDEIDKYFADHGSTEESPPRADDGRPLGEITTEHANERPSKPKPCSAGDIFAMAATQARRQAIFVDDLTGQALPPALCKAARNEELAYFQSKGVWELRKVAEALQRTGRRPISVRWVEVNKGDTENPRIRSRLVAREIRGPGQEACFAPTPPLESLRMVLSYAVSDIQG